MITRMFEFDTDTLKSIATDAIAIARELGASASANENRAVSWLALLKTQGASPATQKVS